MRHETLTGMGRKMLQQIVEHLADVTKQGPPLLRGLHNGCPKQTYSGPLENYPVTNFRGSNLSQISNNSCMRVSRGSMVIGQGQQLKFNFLLALNTKKIEVKRNDFGQIDGWTNIVTYRIICTQLKLHEVITSGSAAFKSYDWSLVKFKMALN